MIYNKYRVKSITDFLFILIHVFIY